MPTKAEILARLNKADLVDVAASNGIDRPRSLTKDELCEILARKMTKPDVEALQSGSTRAKTGTKVPYTLGSKFEVLVAGWAKGKFRGARIKTNYFVRGSSTKRPYEVDVYVEAEVEEAFDSETRFVWVECKDRQASVKRQDIAKLAASVEDVQQMADQDGEVRPYRAIFVSVSEYDQDALELAGAKGIECYWYSGTRFVRQGRVRRDSDNGWL